MSITPFGKDERPTRTAFNERFAQVLTDATAGKYGAGSETTPDDLFSILAKSALIGGDGLTDVLGNAVSVGAKIQTGSYVGTGTYGASNPCSLTFDFEPKLVIWSSSSIPGFYGSSQEATLWVPGMSSYVVANSNGTASVTLSGNTLQWYEPNSSSSYGSNYQLNVSSRVYYWLAIG